MGTTRFQGRKTDDRKKTKFETLQRVQRWGSPIVVVKLRRWSHYIHGCVWKWCNITQKNGIGRIGINQCIQGYDIFRQTHIMVLEYVTIDSMPAAVSIEDPCSLDLCGWGLMAANHFSLYSRHTVDGRNPAPVDRWFIPLFIGLQPSKVVQDFFHPQYLSKSICGMCPLCSLMCPLKGCRRDGILNGRPNEKTMRNAEPKHSN